MVVRLDNEHVIEESITPIVWDDTTGTIIWWETPMRGNTYSIPTGNMGLTPKFPMMWSMTTYSEIQQISCIPTKEQAKDMFRQMLGDEANHDGTIKEASAVKVIDYYYNLASQAFQITSRNESPFNVTPVPIETKAEPEINKDYEHTTQTTNEKDDPYDPNNPNIPLVVPKPVPAPSSGPSVISGSGGGLGPISVDPIIDSGDEF